MLDPLIILLAAVKAGIVCEDLPLVLADLGERRGKLVDLEPVE